MKILLQLICLFNFPLMVYSQTMNVHKNDGTVESYALSRIDSVTFTEPFWVPCTDIPIVNYLGTIYNTVQIGTQCWLQQNLNIGNMIHGFEQQSNNGLVEKYCYNDDSTNCSKYGGLYQWGEVMQYVTTEGALGICPTGWHVPKRIEFQTLAITVNNDGNALRREDQGTGSGQGTNLSGFSALLNGLRYPNGAFGYLDLDFYLHSSTQMNSTDSYRLYMNSASSNVYVDTYYKTAGFAVRCLKN